MSSTHHNQSALKENEGIEQPKSTNELAIKKLQERRRKKLDSQELIKKIIAQDKVALSQAITLVESLNVQHHKQAEEIIQGCLPYANNSIRIGITGVPGVGKSTFIESFGKLLTSLGKKVAVLAIDPSSSVTGGSILGDKTRMEELVKDENAYIRPSASGDSLGGVARKTRESIILCEACGFDTILVETVGVGQSETAVHSMVDFFLLLNLAGAGDELQGIKRGIMEMADAVVINKADGQNQKKAQQAKLEYNRALHLFPKKTSDWTPKVTTCSALHHTGIKEIWELIINYIALTTENQYFYARRKEQNQYWLMETINENILMRFYNNPTIKLLITTNKKAVQNNELSPFAAAQLILKTYFKE
ncbi:methylmalonyl Co-A mutase-associated GTPase MeaB [Myroides pelagicus]|uniref:Methylmalonyl Co-A mutase-associated GTPase MeaB n=1 Tax=Myroides pelagicus TaxID=270914 RepID=A0A7K1GLN5_9FLAO|nr:methylmalonyl Co-A mutase-associated GTPase MeaB [Myroides pelagicus]MEC4113149.1 methylmalonyl Co-A mutase-associated GTPase MeaB [Myroides pelagicus]MTH29802.1 methylmalonyl Co-A mutase-associated GTPase MeaB [Myroides pelagicus]